MSEGQFKEVEFTKESLANIPGPVVIQFGTNWCGHCRRFAPVFEQLLEKYPDVNPIWVEDGPGRPLGRAFKVKLWPTLVFLRDGDIVKQMSRPTETEAAEGFDAVSKVGEP